MDFSGVYTAIVTPFGPSGKIDYDAYANLIEKQVEAGIQGVVPCGTTGESPTLSHEEHREFIKKTVALVKGRIQVIGGAGSNSTEEAKELTKSATADGVDAVMLVNPYYNKPTQEGLYQHFKTIAEATSKPVVVYNIKGRTAVNVEVETMIRLKEIPNIAVVKEASGDLGQMARVQKTCGDKLIMLSGDDVLTPAVMAIGGKGVISVASNLYPKRLVKMVRYYSTGDFTKGNEEFYKLLDFMNAIFWETNPIPIKAAMSFENLCLNSLRLPLTQLASSYVTKLQEVIKNTGPDA